MDISEIAKWKVEIDRMTHFGMAKMSRFAPSGHPCFVLGSAVAEYFDKKYKEKGGMTPEISKMIGWENPNA